MPIACDQRDLDQVDHHHDGGWRADTFKRRDHRPLGIEKGADRIGDAHAADHECRKADERQEL